MLNLSKILPSEEFELTANSLGAYTELTESSPGMGHSELILRTLQLRQSSDTGYANHQVGSIYLMPAVLIKFAGLY